MRKRESGMAGSGLRTASRTCLAWVFWAVMAAVPPSGLGQETTPEKLYDDCIVRNASQPPSPQAALILQRACFYKYLYVRGDAAAKTEHRKLARIYKPAVCDCILEKMPGARPDVPAPMILDACVKASKTPAKPVAP
jgi:hypothetical protein